MLVTFHEAMNRLYTGVWQSFEDDLGFFVPNARWSLEGDILMFSSGSVSVPSRNTIDSFPGVKQYKQLT